MISRRRRLLHLFAVGQEDSVILALDILHNVLHLLGLALPLGLALLLVALEELLVGLAVAAAEAIPQSGELAVIVAGGM